MTMCSEKIVFSFCGEIRGRNEHGVNVVLLTVHLSCVCLSVYVCKSVSQFVSLFVS